MIKDLVRRLWAKFFPPSILMNRNPLYAAYLIGDWTYGNPEILTWQEDSKLKIGKFCAIADGVQILLGGEHHTEWVTSYPFWPFFRDVKRPTGHPFSKGDVVIGNDVWIGREAMILSGVKIGDGAVVAARSLVAKDVPPYAIVAGNPAKILRYRFDPGVIEELLRIAWWDWPEDRIYQHIRELHSPDAGSFIRWFGSSSGNG